MEILQSYELLLLLLLLVLLIFMTDVPSLNQTKTNFVFDFNDFMNLLSPLWFYSSVVDRLLLEKAHLNLNTIVKTILNTTGTKFLYNTIFKNLEKMNIFRVSFI